MRTPLKSIAKAALTRPLPILLILLIGAIGVQTMVSCSSGSDDGTPVSSSSTESSSSTTQSSSSATQSSSSATQELNIYLVANNNEFLTIDGTETVYFYAEVEGGNSDITINLVDSNGNIVAEMKDDGEYSVSGDDIQNDKVFSVKLEIDLSTAGTHIYVAQDGSKNTVSNEVTIYIIPSLTEQDFANIAIVQAEISTLKASDEYAGMNIVERAEAFHTLLTELAERSLIIEGSILYNESSNIISYRYSCGLIGSVRLLEYTFHQTENQQ